MKEPKIVVAGLANAGKTSILRVLDNNIEQIPLLTPTQGVEYNNYKVLGLNVIAWDLGGQISYREKYLRDYQKYFSDTVVLYYVIDIQDEASYKESLKYLKDILDIFPKIDLKDIYIVILLHKFETHVQKAEMRSKESDLKEKISKLLTKFPAKFYDTTIYEPFSIFQAISDGILHQIPGHDSLHQKLNEVGEELQSPAVMIMTNKGYLYGAWHSNDVHVLDLAKFYSSNFNSAGLFLKEEEECRQLAGNEHFSSLVLIFMYKAELVLFSLMIPKGANIESKKAILQKKRGELQQFLTLLKT